MMCKKLISFLMIIIMIVSCVSCKEKTNPKKNFEKYLNAWKKSDYNTMYSIIDKSSKNNISKSDFANKYKEVYEKISVDSISLKANYPEEYTENDDGIIKISFSAVINTIAGETTIEKDVEFSKEKNTEGKEEWRLAWDYGMILPDYQKEYTVKIEDLYGLRGEIYDRNNNPLAINDDDGKRIYPAGSSAGYITGFVSEISKDDLKKEKYKDYKEGDIIGFAGLEYQLEDRLKQKTGKKIYYLDKDKNEVKSIAEKAAEDGEKIKLTINLEVQNLLNQQLTGNVAAGVAMNPTTGEVLALVSTPAYDPNTNHSPSYNKFRASYAPGSTFKVITAAIGLNTGTLNPDEDKQIYGTEWQKSNWGNYYVTRAHSYSPPSNLRNALVYSDNIYFSQVALNVGEDKFVEEIKNYGIGEEFPFDIPLSKESQLFNEDINSEAQLADSAYGQGEILMNPIHMTTIYTYLVNEGNILKPSLIYEENKEAEIWKESVCTKDNTDLILKYLEEVVSSSEGTAHNGYIEGIPIAGKTGTAELKASKDEKGTENGWFIGIETKKKELEICVFVQGVENKGGSVYAVEKAKPVFEKFGK